MTVHFPKDTAFGKEADELLDLIVRTNVKPRFVRSELQLNYKNYADIMHHQTLYADIVTAFRENMLTYNQRTITEAK